MYRLDFIHRLLVLTGFGFPLLQKSGHKRRAYRLYEGCVAGCQYYDWKDLEDTLKQGQPLQLRREPHNRYDHKAIEVFSGRYKLGYISRSDNQILAKLMDQNITLTARVAEYNLDLSVRYGVKVEVAMPSD